MKLRETARLKGLLVFQGPRPWHDGKHRHASHGAAAAHRRAMERKSPETSANLKEYYCGTCFGWHVGRTKEGPSA